MVFVLLTDENSIVVYTDEASAIQACEGIDVEDGVCLFFDEAGHPLEAVFDKPNRRGRFIAASGRYHLRPAPVGSKTLIEWLPKVVNVDGPPSLRSVEEVERHLIEQLVRETEGHPLLEINPHSR